MSDYMCNVQTSEVLGPITSTDVERLRGTHPGAACAATCDGRGGNAPSTERGTSPPKAAVVGSATRGDGCARRGGRRGWSLAGAGVGVGAGAGVGAEGRAQALRPSTNRSGEGEERSMRRGSSALPRLAPAAGGRLPGEAGDGPTPSSPFVLRRARAGGGRAVDASRCLRQAQARGVLDFALQGADGLLPEWLREFLAEERPPPAARPVRTLSLEGNCLRAPPLLSLRRWEALRVLNLAANELRCCPEGLAQAAPRLEELSVANNAIAELPGAYADLQGLRALDCSSNVLTALPSALPPRLEALWLDSNRLVCLPSAVGALMSLAELSCADCLLTAVPTELGLCTQLRRLSLRANNLSAVPPSLGALTTLEELRLDVNALSVLPPSLAACTRLRHLTTGNNGPLLFPPADVCKGGADSVLAFLADARRGGVEAMTLLNGAAGEISSGSRGQSAKDSMSGNREVAGPSAGAIVAADGSHVDQRTFSRLEGALGDERIRAGVALAEKDRALESLRRKDKIVRESAAKLKELESRAQKLSGDNRKLASQVASRDARLADADADAAAAEERARSAEARARGAGARMAASLQRVAELEAATEELVARAEAAEVSVDAAKAAEAALRVVEARCGELARREAALAWQLEEVLAARPPDGGGNTHTEECTTALADVSVQTETEAQAASDAGVSADTPAELPAEPPVDEISPPPAALEVSALIEASNQVAHKVAHPQNYRREDQQQATSTEHQILERERRGKAPMNPKLKRPAHHMPPARMPLS